MSSHSRSARSAGSASGSSSSSTARFSSPDIPALPPLPSRPGVVGLSDATDLVSSAAQVAPTATQLPPSVVPTTLSAAVGPSSRPESPSGTDSSSVYYTSWGSPYQLPTGPDAASARARSIRSSLRGTRKFTAWPLPAPAPLSDDDDDIDTDIANNNILSSLRRPRNAPHDDDGNNDTDDEDPAGLVFGLTHLIPSLPRLRSGRADGQPISPFLLPQNERSPTSSEYPSSAFLTPRSASLSTDPLPASSPGFTMSSPRTGADTDRRPPLYDWAAARLNAIRQPTSADQPDPSKRTADPVEQENDTGSAQVASMSVTTDDVFLAPATSTSAMMALPTPTTAPTSASMSPFSDPTTVSTTSGSSNSRKAVSKKLGKRLFRILMPVSEAGQQRPLSKAETAERISSFIAAGYPSTHSAEREPEWSQVRTLWDDTIATAPPGSADATARTGPKPSVKLPDTRLWEQYIAELREEKLRALGVGSSSTGGTTPVNTALSGPGSIVAEDKSGAANSPDLGSAGLAAGHMLGTSATGGRTSSAGYSPYFSSVGLVSGSGTPILQNATVSAAMPGRSLTPTMHQINPVGPTPAAASMFAHTGVMGPRRRDSVGAFGPTGMSGFPTGPVPNSFESGFTGRGGRVASTPFPHSHSRFASLAPGMGMMPGRMMMSGGLGVSGGGGGGHGPAPHGFHNNGPHNPHLHGHQGHHGHGNMSISFAPGMAVSGPHHPMHQVHPSQQIHPMHQVHPSQQIHQNHPLHPLHPIHTMNQLNQMNSVNPLGPIGPDPGFGSAIHDGGFVSPRMGHHQVNSIAGFNAVPQGGLSPVFGPPVGPVGQSGFISSPLSAGPSMSINKRDRVFENVVEEDENDEDGNQDRPVTKPSGGVSSSTPKPNLADEAARSPPQSADEPQERPPTGTDPAAAARPRGASHVSKQLSVSLNASAKEFIPLASPPATARPRHALHQTPSDGSQSRKITPGSVATSGAAKVRSSPFSGFAAEFKPAGTVSASQTSRAAGGGHKHGRTQSNLSEISLDVMLGRPIAGPASLAGLAALSAQEPVSSIAGWMAGVSNHHARQNSLGLNVAAPEFKPRSEIARTSDRVDSRSFTFPEQSLDEPFVDAAVPAREGDPATETGQVNKPEQVDLVCPVSPAQGDRTGNAEEDDTKEDVETGRIDKADSKLKRTKFSNGTDISNGSSASSTPGPLLARWAGPDEEDDDSDDDEDIVDDVVEHTEPAGPDHRPGLSEATVPTVFGTESVQAETDAAPLADPTGPGDCTVVHRARAGSAADSTVDPTVAALDVAYRAESVHNSDIEPVAESELSRIVESPSPIEAGAAAGRAESDLDADFEIGMNTSMRMDLDRSSGVGSLRISGADSGPSDSDRAESAESESISGQAVLPLEEIDRVMRLINEQSDFGIEQADESDTDDGVVEMPTMPAFSPPPPRSGAPSPSPGRVAFDHSRRSPLPMPMPMSMPMSIPMPMPTAHRPGDVVIPVLSGGVIGTVSRLGGLDDDGEPEVNNGPDSDWNDDAVSAFADQVRLRGGFFDVRVEEVVRRAVGAEISVLADRLDRNSRRPRRRPFGWNVPVVRSGNGNGSDADSEDEGQSTAGDVEPVDELTGSRPVMAALDKILGRLSEVAGRSGGQESQALINHQTDELSRIRAENEQVRAESDRLREDTIRLRTEIAELRAEKEIHDRRAEEDRQTLDRRNTQMETLTTDRNGLITKVAHLKGQLASHAETSATTKALLQSLRVGLAEARQQAETDRSRWVAEVGRLTEQAELHRVRQRVDDQDRRRLIADKERDIDDIRAESEHTRAAVERRHAADLDAVRREVDAVRTASRTAEDQLRRQLTDRDGDVSRAQAGQNELAGRCARLVEQVSTLMSSDVRSSGRNDETDRRVEEAVRRAEAAESRADIAEKRAESAEHRAETAEHRADNADVRAATAEEKNTTMAAQVADADRRMKDVQIRASAAVTAAAQQAVELRHKHAEESPSRHALSWRDSRDASATIRALRETVESLQAQLAGKQADVDALTTRAEAAEAAAAASAGPATDAQLAFVRELLDVQFDDVADLVSRLRQSDEDLDVGALRDSAIRLEAGLQMAAETGCRIGLGPARSGSSTGASAASKRDGLASSPSGTTNSTLGGVARMVKESPARWVSAVFSPASEGNTFSSSSSRSLAAQPGSSTTAPPSAVGALWRRVSESPAVRTIVKPVMHASSGGQTSSSSSGLTVAALGLGKVPFSWTSPEPITPVTSVDPDPDAIELVMDDGMMGDNDGDRSDLMVVLDQSPSTDDDDGVNGTTEGRDGLAMAVEWADHSPQFAAGDIDVIKRARQLGAAGAAE